jgi:hypothetical protein
MANHDKRALLTAIERAFPRIPALRIAVDLELGLNLDAEVDVSTVRNAAFELLTQWAEPRGKVDALVDGLRRAQPDSPELLAYQQRTGRAPKAVAGGVERAVDEFGFLDVRLFSRRLSEVQHRVAYVFAKNGAAEIALGTGLLVRPDLLLTNQHVVAEAQQRGLPVSSLHARFDYFAPGAGVDFAVSSAEPIAAALPAASDPVESSMDPAVLPGPDELDAALLRMVIPVASTIPTGGRTPRGFETLSLSGALPVLGGGIIVVQHPDGMPMRMVVEKPRAVIALRGDRRVRYVANTEGGSSGSPCFDLDWQLVALHHYGGPLRQDNPRLAVWNQGVPTRTIATHSAISGHLP